MSTSASPKSGHLPSLDGLRAISIVLVLLGHLNGTQGFGRLPWLGVFGDIAHLGVVVFFVISGFLITCLLIHERDKTGTVSLKLFYARRALRILPASYVYLAIVGIAAAAGYAVLQRYDIVFALTYLVNYKVDRGWLVGHLWSLSVEEQFYLLWPFAFALLGRTRGVWLSAAFVIMGPLARILGWLFLRHTPYVNLEMFPMVADSLAAGCLLAVTQSWLERQGWYLKLFQPGYAIALTALVLVTNRYMSYTVVSVFGGALINLTLAILVHRSVYCYRDAWGRLLNSRPIVFVGLLSYSLYVWQQPFLNRASMSATARFPLNIVLAVSAALLSYFLLEKPFMKMRSRLRVVPVEVATTPAVEQPAR